MQVLTSLILAAFAAYAGAWYLGKFEGNFALLLFLATVVTGVYWVAERFVFLPRRQRAAAELEANAARRLVELGKMGVTQVDGDITQANHADPQGHRSVENKRLGCRLTDVKVCTPWQHKARQAQVQRAF